MNAPSDPASAHPPAVPPSTALHVSVVSDVVCPWCFIGQSQLEQALAQWRARPDEPAPVVRWYPFQLNPEMPAQGMPRDDYLRAKFGDASREAIHERLNGAASRAGVTLALDRIDRQPNTLKAHALIALAGEAAAGGDADRQHAMARALFAAYFQQGRDLTSDAVLRDIAVEAGLDDATITAALQTRAVHARVAALDADLRRQGVSGVPLFVFARGDSPGLAVSGAQGVDALIGAMTQAMASATS